MFIFLDIDGVMVPAKSWQRPELLPDGFPAFSRSAIRVLQRFLDERTTVILTTSHKSSHSLNEWERIFKRRGLVLFNVMTLDENVGHLNRKDELMNWFETNEIPENFVILDDDTSLNDLSLKLKSHLVLTSTLIGLTDHHIDDILRIAQPLSISKMMR